MLYLYRFSVCDVIDLVVCVINLGEQIDEAINTPFPEGPTSSFKSWVDQFLELLQEIQCLTLQILIHQCSPLSLENNESESLFL